MRPSSMGWPGPDIAEIAGDRALRGYGIALSLLHLGVFRYWQAMVRPAEVLAPTADAICWPFFEQCHAWRLLDPAAISMLLVAYAVVALAAAAAFVSARTTPAAWWLLLAACVFEVVVVAQDYRLRANQHYMAVWATMVFLWLPSRRRNLPLLVVAFYFWAGLLKIDPDWLSGAALSGRRPLFVPEWLIPASCAYVLLLELVIVFGLLARSAWLFWSAAAQVAIFHISSWPVVGAFYPVLMASIVAVFPLTRLIPPPGGAVAARTPTAAGAAVLALFSFLQVVPALFPGDTPVTGEGRMFALHMFDAPIACQPRTTARWTDGRTKTRPLGMGLAGRIHCDPLVHWNLARARCRRLGADPDFVDLDFLLDSRRLSSPELKPVVELRNFCSTPTTYDAWRHNEWIRIW